MNVIDAAFDLAFMWWRARLGGRCRILSARIEATSEPKPNSSTRSGVSPRRPSETPVRVSERLGYGKHTRNPFTLFDGGSNSFVIPLPILSDHFDSTDQTDFITSLLFRKAAVLLHEMYDEWMIKPKKLNRLVVQR